MRRLAVLMLVLTACASPVTVDAAPRSDAARVRDPIVVSLSLYVVDSDDPSLSSQRTIDELEGIAERMNEIWASAGISFEPIRIRTLTAPPDVLAALAGGDATRFLEAAGRAFEVPEPGVVNGFYVAHAGGANGFTPFGSRAFFVDDAPTVHDERVSSHEVGHLFGLHHPLDDPDRLMFSGTNGMALNDQEVEVARYGAQGLLDGL